MIDRMLRPGPVTSAGRRGNTTASFFSDHAGATAVEFAFIAVPFIGLLAGIYETGTSYYRSAQMQATVDQASRLLRLRKVSDSTTYQGFVRNNICTWKTNGGTVKAGTLNKAFDCSKVYLVVMPAIGWEKDKGFRAQEIVIPDQSQKIPLPAPDEVYLVGVFYPSRPIMNILSGAGGQFAKITSGQENFQGSSNVYVLSAMTAFRAEPDG